MLLTDLPSQNAIKFGNLFFKPNQIEEIISKSCRMVLLKAEDETLPFGRTGSSTLIRYNEKFYVVMTRHELKINQAEIPTNKLLETIVVVSSNETIKNFPLNRCIYESTNPEEEFHDLLFFEVDATNEMVKRDAPHFIPVESFSEKHRLQSTVIGCPFLPEVMSEYLEAFIEGKMAPIYQKTVIARCRHDTKFVSENAHFKRYLGGPKQNNLDGFSGGAIISLVEENNNFEMILDGIVVRGGESHIYIVDTNYIKMVLKKDG